MGDQCSAGQLSAWLQKKKSGTSKLRVRQFNKRYFTLDFDSHTFFYTHSEGSSKASAVTAFSDILDVKLPEAEKNQDTNSECSKASKGSFLRRMSSTLSGGGGKDEEHLLLLLLRPAKQMELLCSSTAEAFQWYEALKAAMMMDRSQMTVFEEGTPAIADDDDEDNNQPQVTAQEPTSARTQNLSLIADLTRGQAAERQQEVSEEPEQIVPPPVRGTFLDFGLDTIEENQASEAANASSSSARDGNDITVEQTMVTTAGPTALQACDFGFGEDDEDEASSSSGHSTPRNHGDLDAAATIEISGLDTASQDAPAGHASTSHSYGDRHEGLSMKERLANLDFSDDEDADDDDPLGLRQEK